MFGIMTSAKLHFAHYKKIGRMFAGFGSRSFGTDSDAAKTLSSKIADYFYIFFNMKIMPENYHLFGFDGKSRSEFKQYLGETWNEPFVKKIARLWGNGLILRDKLAFKILCEFYGLPVPKYFGLLKNGEFEGGKDKALALIDHHKPARLALKPVVGQNGVGIQFFSPDQFETVCGAAELRNQTYVIEEAIQQHPDLNKINPHSVNTIRLITFLCRDGKVALLAGMLKASTSKIPVDNFNLGGIAIGIDLDSGRLKQKGFVKFYSPDSVIDNRKSTDPATIQKVLKDIKEMQTRHPGRTFDKHPLTGFVFENFQLPFWQEVVDTAVRAQQVFYHGKAVAWDIAVTPNGPVILEGNEGWGTSAIQATNGGLLTDKNRALFAQYGLHFYEKMKPIARPSARN